MNRKFEYKLWTSDIQEVAQMQAILNDLGKEGWQVVWAAWGAHQGIIWLMREIVS